MDAPDQFEVVGERGLFRLNGSMSLSEAIDFITRAIAFARGRGLPDLLVDALEAVGFDPLTLTQRFFLVTRWADTAEGAIRLALVVRTEMIDRQKFGVTVARNRGLVAEVFASEADASSWLDALR